MRREHVRKWIRIAVATLTLAPFALCVRATTLQFPAELLKRGQIEESRRYEASDGMVLREVRTSDASLARFTTLSEMGPHVPRAIVAAEDQGFRTHLGVSPSAALRATGQNLVKRRVVSGASTLTMQLARLLRPHSRNFVNKFDEAALAMRIEASLSKDAILEEYLNRAPFGPQIRGITSASLAYFGKTPEELSIAEAATLAAIPKSPTVYHVVRNRDRVLRRRDLILRRMRSAGAISKEQLDLSLSEPLSVNWRKGSFGAPHFVRALDQGKHFTRSDSPVVKTTLNATVQRAAEEAVHTIVKSLNDRNVTSAGVVVIENETGNVLSWVGSPNYFDALALGENDAVIALRQPGSALKPFVYAAAIDQLHFDGTTLLPDVELRLTTPSGVYMPLNYDERFHGPVRLREALGNSYNVPAVWTVDRLSVDFTLMQLRRFGFDSLKMPAEHYGPAIALGDGEVSLLNLTNAYATLARGGLSKPVRLRASDPIGTAERVISAKAARLITDVLADSKARVSAFGEVNVLDFGNEVAAKTGTSKAFRDNWTIGYTKDVTVGVWVGNMDGSSMRQISGITGAGPIFRVVMEAARKGHARASVREHEGLEHIKICTLSGKRATGDCPHSIDEWVPADSESHDACSMHVRVAIEPRSGLLAGPSCLITTTRVVETFPPQYQAWAESTRRDLGPTSFAPMCPGSPRGGAAAQLVSPLDGSRFSIDPSRPTHTQAIDLRASSSTDVTFYVDGKSVGRGHHVLWSLRAGHHVIAARAADGHDSTVGIDVD